MPPQGEVVSEPLREEISWDELQKHNNDESTWISVQGVVYDVTNWKLKHPGGYHVLMDVAGQECAQAFSLYHFNPDIVQKYMKPLKVGTMVRSREERESINKDYEDLTKMAEKMGYFEADMAYNFLMFFHGFSVCIMSILIFQLFPLNWLTFITSAVLLGIGQSVVIYHQHAMGHRAITHTIWDRVLQRLCMNFVAGLSASFWNEYHARHHIKPNQLDKDPGITVHERLFVLGTTRAAEIAEKDRNSDRFITPFHFQHIYWFFIGVPIYTPILLQLASFKFTIRQKSWIDLAMMFTFFFWYFPVFIPYLGFWGTMLHLVVSRETFAHIFTWVAVGSHYQLEPEYESAEGDTWFECQAKNAVNLGTDYFSDYFTGYQNWQIEHHLWPTMPFENLRKMSPFVKEICKKYNIDYKQAPTWTIYPNVLKMFKKSGERWHEVYYKAMQGTM